MSNVYVVTSGCYSNYGIDCVFSTRELAQDYIERQRDIESEPLNIEEYQLDKPLEKTVAVIFRVSIELERGNGIRQWQTTSVIDNASDGQGAFLDVFNNGIESVQGYSTVGYVPALRLAADYRQSILRERQTRKKYDAMDAQAKEWLEAHGSQREIVG